MHKARYYKLTEEEENFFLKARKLGIKKTLELFEAIERPNIDVDDLVSYLKQVKKIPTDLEMKVENLSVEVQRIKRNLEMTGGLDTPRKIKIKLRSTYRRNLLGRTPGRVIVCPSRIGGVKFLKQHNAWGFVQIREEYVPYFALYVGRPKSAISYFGEVKSITEPLKSEADLAAAGLKNIEAFEHGKRVIILKPGSLMEFKDPVPLKSNRFVPKSRQYTTLDLLVRANRIEDLWEKATLESHLERIRSPEMKRMAKDLRDATLKISSDIQERITRSNIIFRTSINFAGIYPQSRGFWLSARVPKSELDTTGLDAWQQKNKRWTDIRVNEKTSLERLIKTAKHAYQSV